MSLLPVPQKRRLTSFLGLLALVALAGALALNQPASADKVCPTGAPGKDATPTTLLLQDPAQCLPNPAQSPFTGKRYDTLIEISGSKATGFLVDFKKLLIGFAGAFAILAFFGGAYTYLLSGGNEDHMTKGRHQMLGSILAFAVIISAEAIVGIFEKLFATGTP